MTWETVIGLEVHVQLDTTTKCFCGCANRFGDPPNTNVCAVCLGLPGALPVLNARAVEMAVATALALGCEVPDVSIFARKNYFYPDLPKGYQISQYDRPLAIGGRVPIEVDGEPLEIPLVRLHLEEDAGKSMHDEAGGTGKTRLDLNRCGTPLLEIVSEPALRLPEEAGAYLESLRRLVRWLGVSDGDMSAGSLRCDANVSVRPRGERALGTKTEVKNLNSMKMVEKAIAVEAARQRERLEAGGEVEQATLLWDERSETVRVMRTKEDAQDYRYFPEPDLLPVRIDPAERERARAALPELPLARRDRIEREWGIPAYDAAVLTESVGIADFFEALARAVGDGKLASNWTMGEVLREVNERGGDPAALPVGPDGLAELLGLVRDDVVSQSSAKKVFARMLAEGGSARAIVEEEGLAQISDSAALEAIVERVLAAHPEQAEQVRAGEAKVLGFLVGQVMKESGGKANPKLARELMAGKLGA